MAETVKLDWRGRRFLDLDEDGITLRARSPYRAPFPAGESARPFVANRRLPFAELRLVAVVRRRDYWDLVLAAVMTVVGLAWAAILYPLWIGLAAGLGWILIFGLLPLIQFTVGEPFILVATEDRAIALPYLRRRRQALDRVLDRLRDQCSRSPDRCVVVSRDPPARWVR
jgi:hypothetical protein